MESYSKTAMERAMKVPEMILRAMAKKITDGKRPKSSESAIDRCDVRGSAMKKSAMTDYSIDGAGSPALGGCQ